MTSTIKKYSYEEVFKSPSETAGSIDHALKVLDEIRKAHPASKGWVELNAYIEQVSGGRYRAVRHHAKL